jgi:MtaA/CmuA family methyltransferase
MTKQERFDRLVKGIDLDTDKIFRPILMHFAARFNGKSYAEFASDYRVLVEANVRAMEYFDTDMVGLISDPYRETSAFGSKIEFPKEAVPVCRGPIVKHMDDVLALKNPDVYKEERTLDRIKGAEYFQKLLKGEVPVIGWIEGPLAEACDLVGVEEMLMQLMIDADFSNRLLDKCVITGKDFAKAQMEAGCKIIGIGDAICSQIDAATYDQFVKQRHLEIINFIHERGGMIKLHICGDISHLLPSISELNVDILDLDWEVDADEAFEILGPDVIRCGNINPVEVEKKSADELLQVTDEIVEKEKDRKHIISAGCEITVNTPWENLMAIRNASLNKA